MTYNIIQTGSSGNCIIINDIIMLDCGLPYSKIKDYLSNIKIIFISHIHQDHFKKTTIKKIAFEYPNIKFIVGFHLVEPLLELGIKKQNIFYLEIEKWYDIGICKIRLDYLIHDVPNNAIHIEFPNGEKMLYATDTSSIEHITAKDYTMYFIEANYETDEELQEKIKKEEENGEYSHYKRVLETHLSQLSAINWLDKNMSGNSKYVFIHQHIEKIK